MKQLNFSCLPLIAATGGLMLYASSAAATIVDGDLQTNQISTGPWQQCTTDLPIDENAINDLTEESCAYREAEAVPGVTYKLTCGVRTLKFASITLAYLDVEDNTLATQTTDITGDVSGPYSVSFVSPANTTTAAIGIYGEHGSGFQDCVLLDATPTPEPTEGSISGVSFFDSNADSILDSTERFIPSTPVTLLLNGSGIATSETDADGGYYFGNLDVDQCYTLSFSPADATLQAALPGGDNDAGADGTTAEVCLTEAIPNVANIDAAFVAVPPAVPPADFAICGGTWTDANGDGLFNAGDSATSGVIVQLTSLATGNTTSIDSDNNGNFVFNDLIAGEYQLNFVALDGHEFTINNQQPALGASIANQDGVSAIFNLPEDGNTDSDSACTLQYANGGMIMLPVALEPSHATDDQITMEVGDDFLINVTGNDEPCGDRVDEVTLLGHNVPGNVTVDAASQQLSVTNTTTAGRYTIEYGIRGACGSHDTAIVTVNLEAPAPIVVADAPDAPICRVETGGSSSIGGVDVFNSAEFGFAPQYKLYDRNKELVIITDSTDYTHKFVSQKISVWTSQFFGLWEIEWNGRAYGYDQTSIHYMSAFENGLDSELTACQRHFISPIALDLNNDGLIERIGGQFNADITGDGYIESITEWFAPKQAVLIDSAASGKITGEHLFGNRPGVYADGFEKLAKLDSNNDGELTNNELVTLAIWTDSNSNLSVDEGEVTSLTDNNIKSLPVTHYKFLARAKRITGKSILMEDVWLPLAPVAQLK